MRRRLLLVLALMSVFATATGASAASEKKKGGGESYLQFETLTATLDKGGGRHGVLTVEMGLDVPDGSLRGRAEALEPRLRDAYIRFLITYAAGVAPGAPPNPDAIAAALQRATDTVLGQPGAKLLLGTILAS